ncbi:MAG: AAA family ATPase [Bacilli bacterium]|nr:AAA family ATPase [Bacilli bacterium]
MVIPFNNKQKYVISEAIKFYRHSSEQVFQYAGFAGTGKSSVLFEIERQLKIPRHRIATMAYTGAAAIVLRMKGIMNASTIHSWLYRPVEDILLDINGKPQINEYFNRPKFSLRFEPKPLDNIDLIVIDEGGMVPYNMKNEIESRGIKIIVTGDLDQLPPVADKPAYLYDGKVYVLDEIMRHEMNSAKVYIADRIRKGLPIHKGFYGDVYVIDQDEFTDEMALYSDVVLSGKNSTRQYVNSHIRELLGYNSDLPSFGERLICRKNNWNLEIDGISMANGLRGVVLNYPNIHGFDGKNYTKDFKPDFMSSFFPQLSCDYKYLKAPYGNKDAIKYDKFSTGEKMEYGYGLTVHLSQGSQFNNVVYLEEYLSKDIQAKLDNTAVTRAINNLIYVKQKRKYY